MTVTGGGQTSTPERASVQVNETLTSVLFQPLPLAAGVAVAVTAGGVRSMLIVTLAEAVLPALSTAVPLTVWLAPSVPTTTVAGQVSIPERTSVHVNPALTGVLFQPLPLGAGEPAPVIAGGALSMLSVTLAEAILPALSTAVPVTTCPAPSVATVTGPVQLAMPEVASAQVNVTMTLVLFQPFAFGGGLAWAVIVGASSSVPTISTMIAPPGFPWTLTAISLLARRVTGLSRIVVSFLKSLGDRTWMRLIQIVPDTCPESTSSSPSCSCSLPATV